MSNNDLSVNESLVVVVVAVVDVWGLDFDFSWCEPVWLLLLLVVVVLPVALPPGRLVPLVAIRFCRMMVLMSVKKDLDSLTDMVVAFFVKGLLFGQFVESESWWDQFCGRSL